MYQTGAHGSHALQPDCRKAIPIVLVDNDPRARLVLTNGLRQSFHVATADSGAAAHRTDRRDLAHARRELRVGRLWSQAGVIVSAAEIARVATGMSPRSREHAASVARRYVHQLRLKLGDALIETDRQRGYRLRVPQRQP